MFDKPDPVTEKARYPALRAVASLLRILAILTLLAAVVLLIAALGTSSEGGEATGFIVALGAFISALVLWAWAELIGVLIDVEEHARRIAARLAGDGPPPAVSTPS